MMNTFATPLLLDLKSSAAPSDDFARFTGLAAVYDLVDSYNDQILPGAFRDHLATHGAAIKILNQHDPNDPIGTGILTDSARGLVIDGAILTTIRSGKDAATRLREGLVDGLSIGYSVPAGGAMFKGNIRQLKQIDLMEVSLVSFPAQASARVTAVKSRLAPSWDGILADVRATKSQLQHDAQSRMLLELLAEIRHVRRSLAR
jgi:HK97 family phage prohead protease